MKFPWGSKTHKERGLSHVGELELGDIVELTDSPKLPERLRAESLEISKVDTYEYSDERVICFTARDSSNQEICISVPERSDGSELTFSLVVNENAVRRIFGDHFSDLWEDSRTELEVLDSPDDLKGWLANLYRQSMQDGEAYFHEKDYRGKEIPDDEGDALRYHECEGDEDRYSLSVEIWGDGETEVCLEVTCPSIVVKELYPNVKD